MAYLIPDNLELGNKASVDIIQTTPTPAGELGSFKVCGDLFIDGR